MPTYQKQLKENKLAIAIILMNILVYYNLYQKIYSRLQNVHPITHATELRFNVRPTIFNSLFPVLVRQKHHAGGRLLLLIYYLLSTILKGAH